MIWAFVAIIVWALIILGGAWYIDNIEYQEPKSRSYKKPKVRAKTPEPDEESDNHGRH